MEKEFKKIGTHDGKFHADEVMATAILNEIFTTELTRTRNKKVLGRLDIVYDVNGGEFDHHGIDKVLREDEIPFSSCGLIWNKFGKDVIRYKNENLNEKEIEDVFQYIDKYLIEGIDALDNGIWIDKSEVPLMHVSSILASFNPLWNEENIENECFDKATLFASNILCNKINFKLSVLKAKDKVVTAFNVREIKEVLILDTYCPYIESLKELDKNEEILFVIFKSQKNYLIQTVRGKDGEDRKKLPRAWLGLREEELAKITGVNDAVFCHTGRFIAAAVSLEGIKKMAEIAINSPNENKYKTNKIIKLLKKLLKKRK